MTDQFFEVPARSKFAGDTKDYVIDLRFLTRSYWIAGRYYVASETVRAPSLPGFGYSANAAGEAGGIEPPWSRTIGGTTQDGSITWTTVTPVGNGVDPISTAVWSVLSGPDSVLTIPSSEALYEETGVTFAAGTSGATYRAQCIATTVAGKVYVVQMDVEVQ